MRCLMFVVCAALVVSCVGCQPAAPPPAGGSGTTATAEAPSIKISSDLDAKLAAADLADGVEDKKISKCYACSLAMDGDESLTVKVNGYTACFCSEGCCKHFEDEAEKMVAETPEPAGGDDA